MYIYSKYRMRMHPMKGQLTAVMRFFEFSKHRYEVDTKNNIVYLDKVSETK